MVVVAGIMMAAGMVMCRLRVPGPVLCFGDQRMGAVRQSLDSRGQAQG
jgi:hypothetical protein